MDKSTFYKTLRRYKKTKVAAQSHKNRSHFLQRCIEEKVIPKSIAKPLQPSHHIFPDYLENFLSSSSFLLKQQSFALTLEADSLLKSLQQDKLFTNTTSNILTKSVDNSNKKHLTKLDRKLQNLITHSEWKHLGRPDMVQNHSNIHLSSTEFEALSFGLKFATGIQNNYITQSTLLNYRNSDNDLTKGFLQGISFAASTTPQERTLPKRYITALRNLAAIPNIVISPADKTGGVVILNRSDYHDKIMDILNDRSTYESTDLKTINKNNETFIKFFKISTNQAKEWTSLISFHSTIPTLYGLPKTHKHNMPLRPIISSIGSVSHNIAKSLAKILSPLLGTISNAHITNSGHLLKKLQDITLHNHTMHSLDITSLYTNIPVKKCINLLSKHLNKINFSCSLPIKSIIDIIRNITSLTFFKYNNDYYRQKFGLPMGNPLSPVLACLFLEFLEIGPFSYRIPKNATYFRYIDDILIFLPDSHKIETLAQALNKVEPSIKFTFESEQNNSLAFLDILILKNNNSLSFQVHRKPTNKNDYLHYYSHHNNYIKNSMIIGFYLRALRICSPEHLSQEYNKIESSLTTLKYPKHVILSAKKKASQIHLKKIKNTNTSPNTTQSILRNVFLPTNSRNTHLFSSLSQHSFRIIQATSLTIKNILQMHKNKSKVLSSPTTAGIYTIPCADCGKIYFGETQRPLKKRIYEHNRAIKNGDTSNALCTHMISSGHHFNTHKAIPIKNIHDTKLRRLTESCLILCHKNTIAQRQGFYNIYFPTARSILYEMNLNEYDSG